MMFILCPWSSPAFSFFFCVCLAMINLWTIDAQRGRGVASNMAEGGMRRGRLSGVLLCRLSGFLLKLHCGNYSYRRSLMQSRFTGEWCGWRRTLVRVASGVVCVDLCQVISLSSLYTALPIFLLSSQLESCYSTGNQTWNLALRISVFPGPKE